MAFPGAGGDGPAALHVPRTYLMIGAAAITYMIFHLNMEMSMASIRAAV
jgi:hypothetical protein